MAASLRKSSCIMLTLVAALFAGAAIAKGDPVNEYLTHYRPGVDGVFSDAADTALFARDKADSSN